MHKASPERFGAFLADTVLEDISIWGASARLRDELPDELEMQYGDSFELHTCTTITRQRFMPHMGCDSLKPAQTNRLQYWKSPCAPYTRCRRQWTKPLFEQFQMVTLRVHTISFAREWIRDMSARMGLRPILLPLALTHPAAVRAPKKRTGKKDRGYQEVVLRCGPTYPTKSRRFSLVPPPIHPKHSAGNLERESRKLFKLNGLAIHFDNPLVPVFVSRRL